MHNEQPGHAASVALRGITRFELADETSTRALNAAGSVINPACTGIVANCAEGKFALTHCFASSAHASFAKKSTGLPERSKSIAVCDTSVAKPSTPR